MSVKKSVCFTLINNFQFRQLFNELSWNHTTNNEQVAVDGQQYHLEAIAEKSVFFVFHCKTSGKVPDYAIRKKIDSAITKLYDQHLIIYSDSNRRQQVWQLVVKELDKPAVVRETSYFSTQEPELLFQKLQHLFFTIDEEDNITIVDVIGRVQTGFNTNAEKITKKFYEGFKKEHVAFLSFINGIAESQDRDWYASLMLNRLMFIYFIQKKGFLNDDKFYLKTKLAETLFVKGTNKFYSFYRNFLLVLFHQGLGSPDNRKYEKELGKVPYLNGGLFDLHELESRYTGIQIEDKAFERIFDFFDQYEWHLDTRQQATGKEINPDVIGYIFEKYINDRAAMGAYYTKEDITDYIGKNCIIPFLFDELKQRYPAALKPDGEVWSLLKNHADDYIYDAVKHGINQPPSIPPCQVAPSLDKGRAGEGLALPPEIAAGLDDVSKRTEWNKPAPPEYALPTEIWREVVERRRRYAEVKEKIEAGEIHEINDLITYNLNISKFAIDVIQNSNDQELIRHFYKALEKITVLDPTCGSGAFLFAALNILEPLYEACLGRMHAFVSEAIEGKYKAFEEILKRVNTPEHPNLQYFIFKTIILNNLFGVDIMKEAIEIAKLRLFLKLVSTVDVDYKKPNMGLEPLPDIDFNIRSGNSLVGFVSIEEVKKAVEGQLGFYDEDIASIEEAAGYVRRAYDSFREVQMVGDVTVKEFKKILTEKMAKLNDRLDVYLGKLYGKDPKKASEYKAWHDSHKPFHWFAEFYDIVHDRGGFDVIIGNPPYVEYSKTKNDYSIKGYKTEHCGNLYAYVMEKSYKINSITGRNGLIVPMSITSIRDYKELRDLVFDQYKSTWITNHAIRPTSLFTGISQRVSIVNCSRNGNKSVYTTNYCRTFDSKYLFKNIKYANIPSHFFIDGLIPKISTEIESTIFNKLLAIKPISEIHFQKAPHNLMYFKDYGETYWLFPFNFEPWLTLVKSYNQLAFRDKSVLNCVVAYLNSSAFYWFYSLISDCWHFGKWHISKAPIGYDIMQNDIILNLNKLAETLMENFRENRITRFDTRINGDLYEYKVSQSKNIIDKIDTILAKHYGFTDEELDFIINYDIKYRMGKGAGEEDGDE